ncbi:hypothetical protein MBLNU459_g1188t1 [Dothideomycetes sp. NU459]
MEKDKAIPFVVPAGGVKTHKSGRLRQFMSHEGRRIHIAASPEEAETLRRHHTTNKYPFDLFICDSPEHLDIVRNTYGHYEERRDALRQQYTDIYDQFQHVHSQLDALTAELEHITDRNMQLDASFSKYGYSATPYQHEVESFELFVDLLYVGIIAINGDYASEDATGLSLLRLFITFTLSYKIWGDMNLLVSWFDTNDIGRRLSTLFLLACLLGYTTNITMSSESTYSQLIAFYLAARLFIGTYLVYVAIMLSMIRAIMISQVVAILLAAALWIGSIYVAWPQRLGLVLVALVLDLFGQMVYRIVIDACNVVSPKTRAWAEQNFEFWPAINIEYKTERTNAFVTLVFGYTVVTIIYQNTASFGLNAFFLKGIMGLVQAFCFNWLYFEVDGANLLQHAIRRHMFTSFAWSNVHLPFIMAFILASGALSRLVVATDCGDAEAEWLTEAFATRNQSRANNDQRLLYRPRTYKRLIVASDGTWLNSDSGSLKDQLSIPSNVTRIARAIKVVSSDGIQQIVYYHRGVGSGGGIIDRVYGGITGEGLGENVREGYEFLSSNYEEGDEIFFLGFSRGAYTARAMAGLIGEVGLLTRKGIPYLAEIFRDVQHQHDPDYRPKHVDLPFKDKPSANEPLYRHELARRGMTRLGVPIKAIGVWETVGSLGTPRVGWLERIGVQSSASKRMGFYDTTLSNCIENAFQALALDERRFSFSPAVWEKMPSNTTRLRQVWFPGVHSNVGGGYDDQELANITLAWMMSHMREFLDMDLDYVLDQQDMTELYYERSGQRPRPWSFGKIYNSMAGVYALGGAATRTPGRYFVVDPQNGRETEVPLRDTHEYVHASARSRIRLKGPGYDDKETYTPRALKDWKLVIEYDDDGHDGRGNRKTRPNIFWRLTTKQKNVSSRVLPECPLHPLERELLEMDPEVEDAVLRPSPTARQRRDTKGRSRSPGRTRSRA